MVSMQTINVHIPSMLADCIDGARSICLQAETLAGALEQLRQVNPLLRRHIFDESGAVRRNVLIFHNDQNIAWIEDPNMLLKPGDELHVVPAVSGGK
jgi:molybdopterin converting factor small subunit